MYRSLPESGHTARPIASLAALFSLILVACGGNIDFHFPEPVGPFVAPPPGPLVALSPGEVYIQDFSIVGGFSRVDLSSGAMTPQASLDCLDSPADAALLGAAVGPDGVAIGSRADGTIVKFDLDRGHCVAMFTAPEPILPLAIAPDGTLIGQTADDPAVPERARGIYRLTASGAVISKVPLAGVTVLGGLSYAPNGRLYGVGIVGLNDARWIELDPTTGIAVSVASGNQLGLFQVCIDYAGNAYGHWHGVLYRYDALTGALMSSLTLARDMGLGAIVCR